MSEFDLEKFAKYPFLRCAKGYVASLGLTLGDIQKDPVYSASIALGRMRAQDALNGRINLRLGDTLSKELSVLSYAIAKILVNLTGNRLIISRYASAEAENSYRFLKNEEDGTLRDIANDLNVHMDKNKMHFSTYLKLCTNLTRIDSKWKLVNRGMEMGYVEINKKEIPVLLREAIRLRVMESVETRGVPDEFKKISNGLSIDFIRKDIEMNVDEINENALPPCIKNMLASMESGKITHSGMFIIGTFFLGLGLDVDGVIKIFSRYPRFNKEKTRYQLEFLAGEKGAMRYSCPSCTRIKSYGLCMAECIVKHPLQYYRDMS